MFLTRRFQKDHMRSNRPATILRAPPESSSRSLKTALTAMRASACLFWLFVLASLPSPAQEVPRVQVFGGYSATRGLLSAWETLQETRHGRLWWEVTSTTPFLPALLGEWCKSITCIRACFMALKITCASRLGWCTAGERSGRRATSGGARRLRSGARRIPHS